MSQNNKRLTFVITRAAYGSSLGQNALEAILATSVFDQPVTVIFTEDGIYQLIARGNTEKLRLKDYRRNFLELPSYGVEKIYIDETSALQRGIAKDDLLPVAEWVDQDQLTALLSNTDHILTF
jgi:tRNA 2-thiouridine synthesizing protein C